MRCLTLPDLDRVRDAPERGTLVLLLAALDVADSAIRLEHPCLDFEPLPAKPVPPTTELLAELLLTSFAELARLIQHYNAAVDDALGEHHPDHMPF